MQTLRKENELRFQKEFSNNQLKNAVICETIAQESENMSYSEAVYWGKRAVKFAEKAYGKRSIAVTVHYDKFVELLSCAGYHPQALEWSEKSKKIKIAEYGEESFEVTENDWMLSRIYSNLFKYDIAIEIAKKVIPVYENKYGEKSQEVFDIHLKLISMYRLSKCDEKAKEFSEKAVRIAEETFGADSIQAAAAYEKKAVAFYGEGRSEEKLLLLKKALLIYYHKCGVKDLGTNGVFCTIWRCWAEEGYDNSTAVAHGLKWIKDNVSEDYVRDKLYRFDCSTREELQRFLDET